MDEVLVVEKANLKSRPSWNFEEFKIDLRDDIAVQHNNFDCGVFVMQYVISPYTMQRPRYMVSPKLMKKIIFLNDFFFHRYAWHIIKGGKGLDTVSFFKAFCYLDVVMQYNSDSQRARLAVQFLISMWNGMRTTLFELADNLFKDVSSGAVEVLTPSQFQRLQIPCPTENTRPPRIEDEGNSDIIPFRKEVEEEVQESPRPPKRKRNMKSLKGK